MIFSRFRKAIKNPTPRPEKAEGIGDREAKRALLDSGLFDHRYYADAMGLGAASPSTLADHFLLNAVPLELSPHPLVELEYLPRALRSGYGHPGGIEAVISYLRSLPARQHAWGPLFDPRAIENPEADPFDVLVAIEDGDQLPVPSDFRRESPTMEDARRVLSGYMRDHSDQFAAALPPRRRSWDRALTKKWVGEISRATDGAPGALVSVVMPVLNRAATVRAAIESVLTQTHEHIELIVVDDGSTDESRDVVQAYADQDPRVKLLAGPHSGVGAARNTGLEVATGEYIAFLDSDNTWTRRYVELSLRGLQQAPHAVASHAALRLHGDGNSVQHRGGAAQYTDLQIGNSIDLNVLVVRASTLSAVGFFDVSLRRWVDYDLVLRIAKTGHLEYLPFIGCDYDDRKAEGRITQQESLHWQWVVRERDLVDWPALRAGVTARRTGLTSVIVTVAGSTKYSLTSIDLLLDEHPDDVEVVFVDNGSRPAIGRKIAARFCGEPRVRYVRLPVNNNFAVAANVGFACTRGDRVVFLDSDAQPRTGWLTSLIRTMAETHASGAQALLLNPDYTVQHAGYAYFDRVPLPSPFLAGLTIADAQEVDLSRLRAIGANASIFSSRDFAAVSGFDPMFANGLEDADLCERLRDELGADTRFACSASALVVHDVPTAVPARLRRAETNTSTYLRRWADRPIDDDRGRFTELGMRVTHLQHVHSMGRSSVLPILTRNLPDAAESGVPARLRWAIKTGVPSTRGGDHWGDIPFAADLAAALRARGQQVVTDRYEAWNRQTTYIDDVVLTLRGRHPVPPQPGAVNIMWVISRPDLVSVAEVQSYDVVFAASAKWAAWMSERSGRHIETLLQATSPDRFRPDGPTIDDPDDLIFVGGSHGHEYGRAIVGLALQAEAPVGLWGPGWAKFAPDHAVRGRYIASEDLPMAYRSANIVLNDHYEDMAEWGFINNRTFDAIACGTPIISDAIEGLEIFEGAVVVADSVDRMRELVVDRSWQPSPERMSALAAHIRSEHSFDARAARLVRAATGGFVK